MPLVTVVRVVIPNTFPLLIGGGVCTLESTITESRSPEKMPIDLSKTTLDVPIEMPVVVLPCVTRN